MASTSDIKNGFCLYFSNDTYSVVSFLHVKPGKGNAFVRTKMKSLTSGKVIEYTFPAGHRIDQVRVERRKFQYLYNDDMGYHFMDMESFDQVAIQKKMIDNARFLKEGMDIEILFDAQKEIPLTIDLPQYVTMEITYTEPGVRGDTATNVTKPATIQSGAEIKVPIFINQGDKVKIDTKNGDYIERVKS